MFDTLFSIYNENYPPKPKWTAKDMPDLTGRIVMVTGGNSGIGYETVLALLQKNAKVYIAGRSEQRVREAIESMQKQDPSLSSKFVDYIPLDLSSLRSIEQCEKIYASKEQRLDLLFCSAGVMLTPKGSVTKEGIELQMGANALGHYYLTKLLLPQLRASAKASPTNPPRVCFTSSVAHHAGSPKGFDPEDPYGEKTSSLLVPASARAYGCSKLANILTANWFQRHYGNEGITFTSVHPGVLRTNLTRYMSNLHQRIVSTLLAYPQELGAITQLYANTAPEAAGKGGTYFIPWAREGKAEPSAYSESAQETAIEWFEKQIAAHPAA